jgi:hypothetical protein
MGQHYGRPTSCMHMPRCEAQGLNTYASCTLQMKPSRSALSCQLVMATCDGGYCILQGNTDGAVAPARAWHSSICEPCKQSISMQRESPKQAEFVYMPSVLRSFRQTMASQLPVCLLQACESSTSPPCRKCVPVELCYRTPRRWVTHHIPDLSCCVLQLLPVQIDTKPMVSIETSCDIWYGACGLNACR